MKWRTENLHRYHSLKYDRWNHAQSQNPASERLNSVIADLRRQTMTEQVEAGSEKTG